MREGFTPASSSSNGNDDNDEGAEHNSRTIYDVKEKIPPPTDKNQTSLSIHEGNTHDDENNATRGGKISFTASSELYTNDIDDSSVIDGEIVIPDSIYRAYVILGDVVIAIQKMTSGL